MDSSYLVAGSCLIAVLLFRYFSRQLRVHSIAHLPGPPPGSWLVGKLRNLPLEEAGLSPSSGNIPELVRGENVGDADFEWVKAFGPSMRIKGPLGVSVAPGQGKIKA
jgi:hypothetical protein